MLDLALTGSAAAPIAGRSAPPATVTLQAKIQDGLSVKDNQHLTDGGRAAQSRAGVAVPGPAEVRLQSMPAP